MKISCKMWIERNGTTFGDGPYRLLEGVEKTDSLHKAAAQMGMSYSKAWKLIRKVEQKFGFPLLDRRVGGQSGGGSQLTPQAKELMICFGRFREEVKNSIERMFQKHFVSLSKSQRWRRISHR